MKGEGGITSCIGFTLTFRSAGPGCASQVLADFSSPPAFAMLRPQFRYSFHPGEFGPLLLGLIVKDVALRAAAESGQQSTEI